MIKKLLVYFVVALFSSFALSSCSNEDDGFTGNGDFIEVKIDGKTYRHEVYGVYAEISMDNDMLLTYSTENVFYDDGFQFFYGIFHHENRDKMLESSVGSYGVSDYNAYNNKANNLDFMASLELNSGDAWWDSESGSHQVTSIKAVEDGVEVEGTFNLTMYGDEYGERKVSGKYRMTVGGY